MDDIFWIYVVECLENWLLCNKYAKVNDKCIKSPQIEEIHLEKWNNTNKSIKRIIFLITLPNLPTIPLKIPQHKLLHIQTLHFLHKLLTKYFLKIKSLPIHHTWPTHMNITRFIFFIKLSLHPHPCNWLIIMFFIIFDTFLLEFVKIIFTFQEILGPGLYEG